jgi:hypothetical protein
MSIIDLIGVLSRNAFSLEEGQLNQNTDISAIINTIRKKSIF